MAGRSCYERVNYDPDIGLKINGWKCIAKYEHHNLWKRNCDSQANTIKESFPKYSVPKRVNIFLD